MGAVTLSPQSLAQRNPGEKLGERIAKRKMILHLVHPANSLVMDKLDGVSAFNNQDIKAMIFRIFDNLRLVIFACMQSGLTKPPLVHRLVVCAAHLIFGSWMDVIYWIYIVLNIWVLMKDCIITKSSPSQIS